LIADAVGDADSRVRVSAIRSLGALKDAKAADKLLERGALLLKKGIWPRFSNPAGKNELLEIATVLGRLLPKTDNEKSVQFLNDLGAKDSFNSPEVHIAMARISPASIVGIKIPENICTPDSARSVPYCWQFFSAWAQGMGELAALDEKDPIRAKAAELLRGMLKTQFENRHGTDQISRIAISDELAAYAAFKPEDISSVARDFLTHDDLFIRAAAAGVLAEQLASEENVEALKTAFTKALLTDKTHNDAQLGILDALAKLDKKESVGTFLIALSAPDHLVRKKAMDLIGDKDLQKDFPGLPTSLENARAKGKDRPQPYSPAFGTKLGAILNTNADYTRAVSRKNGSVKALFTTDKGAFTIELLPEDAPLTVDNFIKLARSNYFNGVMVHRVVPNFVMQDGDPRGDGNGGPGWSIRCEVNMAPYDRGAVGMALSGKDTGGSQWFVTHSPQPHLDGGYTVFGHVYENDMKVVDNIARGDRIVSVKIVEGTVRRPAHN
jgi:cyclophilin family peptidyl-prolyl cis-trans isomerase